MRRLIPTLALGLGSCLASQAQLYIDNATFFIETGATVTVQGDLTSNVSIQGPGKILLKGSTLQNVNMNNGGAVTNAYTIPNLEVDNAANVALTGNVKVGTNLTFTTGKIQAGNFNFVLANLATVTTPGAGKFIETNGTGYAQRELAAASANLLLPVGTGSNYTPISLSHAGGTYSATSLVGAQSKLAKSPNAHPRTESYTNDYWPVASTNITGGTLTGVGTYNDPGFTGTETDIRGMSFNGTDWTLTGGNQDFAANTVTGQLSVASGQIFGMNRFLLLRSKVLLQGAYSGSGSVMNDTYRSFGLLPTTDPYRVAPYNTAFIQVNNAVAETATPTAFNDFATNQNVVDWVFIELRDETQAVGSKVVQTRSGLLQKDGTIVDIDNGSPIYFKNLNAANYTVVVRHRNHLGIGTNPANFNAALSLSPSAILDFTTAPDANVFGTSGSAYTTANGFKMLWAGNANLNGNVKINGGGNDPDFILNTLLGGVTNATNNLTTPAHYLTWGQGDVNFNRNVKINGGGNDKDYILNTVLAGVVNASRTEALPAK
ncbi:MAG: hypothetical protein ABIX01_21745 [Chitinophagaceae bacterium]